MAPGDSRSYGWFLTGFGLVNAVTFTFIGMSLTFISGHGLAFWHFPLAVFFALLVNLAAARYFLGAGYIRAFVTSSCIILAVITLSILLSAYIYDISYDGQLYHLDSAFHLKNGWNPFKKELSPEVNQAFWINHYGKGVEAPQAAVYALTNRIETTKSTNFILLAASFCLSMSLLLRLNRFSFRRNLLFSFLLSFNPVTIYQLLNTYVDGQMASYLLCFIVVGCLLYLDANRFHLLLLATVLMVVLNIKFSAIVIAAVFCAGLLLALIIGRQKQTFRKVFIVCVLATGLGIGVVGYYPYVTNTIHYHDPIYPGLPLLQSEAARLCPGNFAHMNRFSKFFVSFFSHTNDFHIYREKNPVVSPKIPFSFNKTDLFNAVKPYVVIMAGFGPFFSGICMTALLIFIVSVWRLPNRKPLVPVLVLLGTIMCSVFIISEDWFARYIPQLWFAPVIALIAAEYFRPGAFGKLKNLLYVIMLINLSFGFASFAYVYYKTVQINYNLARLKASGQTIPVYFRYYTSNRIRFAEHHIPIREQVIPDDEGEFMVSSSSKYIPPNPLPDLPKPWILQIGERLEHRIRPWTFMGIQKYIYLPHEDCHHQWAQFESARNPGAGYLWQADL
jgi:hypothetical protein